MSDTDITSVGRIGREFRYVVRFVTDSVFMAVVGSVQYYAWILGLVVLLGLGMYSYVLQYTTGSIVLGVRQPIPWALYIAFWGYFVEIGTGAMVVLAFAYIRYDNRTFRRQSIIAGALAIAGIVAGMAAVVVDLGRPTRMFNLFPVIGTMNFPDSMFAWDTIVLNGYLVLVVLSFGLLLYRRFTRRPLGRWIGRVLFLAVPWAFWILIVDPFIFGGVAARGTWHSAIIAPRFIMGAVAVGPAATILTMDLVERYTRAGDYGVWIPENYYQLLGGIMLIALFGSLVIFISEVFIAAYARTAHWSTIKYLLVGIEHHGHLYNALTPWTWFMVGLQLLAVFILIPVPFPHMRRSRFWLLIASIATVVSIFLDKVILVLSGFVITPLGQVYQYTPTLVEMIVSLGTIAVGLLTVTILLRIGLAIELDATVNPEAEPRPRSLIEE